MTNIADAKRAKDDDRRQALGATPVFHCLSMDELQSIMVLASARSYDAGAILITDGDDDEDVFVIVTGAAAVFKNGSHITYLRRGDIVGEMAMITGQPRSATVIMAERGDVLRLPREVYGELVERHPEMWRDLCYMVSQRLCETTSLQSAKAATASLVA